MAGLVLWVEVVDTSTIMVVGDRAQAGITRDIDKVSGRRLRPPEDTLRSPTGITDQEQDIQTSVSLALLQAQQILTRQPRSMTTVEILTMRCCHRQKLSAVVLQLAAVAVLAAITGATWEMRGIMWWIALWTPPVEILLSHPPSIGAMKQSMKEIVTLT